MNKGKVPGRVVRGEFGNAPVRYRPTQFKPRDELVEIFKDAPRLDYERFRADIDAYVDPSAWGWDDWKTWSDRHLGRAGPAND